MSVRHSSVKRARRRAVVAVFAATALMAGCGGPVTRAASRTGP